MARQAWTGLDGQAGRRTEVTTLAGLCNCLAPAYYWLSWAWERPEVPGTQRPDVTTEYRAEVDSGLKARSRTVKQILTFHCSSWNPYLREEEGTLVAQARSGIPAAVQAAGSGPESGRFGEESQ